MHTTSTVCTVPQSKNTPPKSTAPSWNNVRHNVPCKPSREHFWLTCPYMGLDRPEWEEKVHAWWTYSLNTIGSPIAPRLSVKCFASVQDKSSQFYLCSATITEVISRLLKRANLVLIFWAPNIQISSFENYLGEVLKLWRWLKCRECGGNRCLGRWGCKEGYSTEVASSVLTEIFWDFSFSVKDSDSFDGQIYSDTFGLKPESWERGIDESRHGNKGCLYYGVNYKQAKQIEWGETAKMVEIKWLCFKWPLSSCTTNATLLILVETKILQTHYLLESH